jgi:[ribosomal protein S5]-alanine N-acetyltransferase
MIYETKRLILSPFEKKDITDEYLSWFHSPLVTKYNTHGLGKMNHEDAEKYLDDNPDNIIFGVWIKYDSALPKDQKEQYNSMVRTLSREDFAVKHIGNISLQSINNLNRSAEFACVFGETEYWGKGYATESLKVLIDHGFKRMNLNRIWTGTAATNIGMRGVARKLGMAEEGIFKEGVFLDGKYQDVHVYGLLKSYWRA